MARPKPKLETSFDLSPITLSEAIFGGRTFRFREPITWYPFANEIGTLVCAEYEPYFSYLFAASREELIETIQGEIAFLWDGYAQEKDERLSKDARELKEILLREIIEVSERA